MISSENVALCVAAVNQGAYCCICSELFSCFTFLAGGSGFSSKPTTPTGTGGAFPPMSSPQRPTASPQHTTAGWQSSTAFPSWQHGGAAQWQSQGQAKAPGPSMTHSSPQNRPNYNVSFSGMGSATPGVKAQPNTGQWHKKSFIRWYAYIICAFIFYF